MILQTAAHISYHEGTNRNDNYHEWFVIVCFNLYF